jgi:hypothetical protein
LRRPGWRGWRVGGKRANAEIHWSKERRNVFDAGFRGEDEEVFGCWITDSQTANGGGAAVNHYVRAQIGSTVAATLFLVKGVGIIDAKGEMETAVGIEGFDFVEAFGNLTISFFQFRAKCATGGKDRIGFEETKIR